MSNNNTGTNNSGYVQNLMENVYVIAKKIESDSKPQPQKIDENEL